MLPPGRFWNWLTSKKHYYCLVQVEWIFFSFFLPFVQLEAKAPLISGWHVLKAFNFSGLWLGSCWDLPWLFVSVLNRTEAKWRIINDDYHLNTNNKAKEWLLHLFIIYHFTVFLFKLNADFDCCGKQHIQCWAVTPLHWCWVEEKMVYVGIEPFWPS